MLIEHPVYSLAIAVIFGMVYRKHTGREMSWIIVLSAYAPDLDVVATYALSALNSLGITNFTEPCGCPLDLHGDFHNLSFLLLYAAIVAFLLNHWGFRFWDAFVFAGVGFGAHLIEDALVFKQAYPFFWPLTTRIFGIGVIEYQADFYGIADTTVLTLGLVFLLAAITLRTLYERKNWWKELIISNS